MPRYAENLLGRRFGKLLVVSRLPAKEHNTYRWKCLCDCGGINYVLSNNLKSGGTKSCGCQQGAHVGTQNNLSTTAAYRTWTSMMSRCYNTDADNFKWYGARGIFVEESWHNFQQFFLDMGQPPKGFWIERRDNNKGYSKLNCLWVTPQVNCQNRRQPV